jgi:hypothetical protein
LGIDDATRLVASAGRSEWINYSLIITLTGKKEYLYHRFVNLSHDITM